MLAVRDFTMTRVQLLHDVVGGGMEETVAGEMLHSGTSYLLLGPAYHWRFVKHPRQRGEPTINIYFTM